MRLSYAFNDSYVSEIRKEYWRILTVKESPMWERRGAASKENWIGHNSLETLAEPGKMSTAKTDITVRTEECQGRVLCEIYHHLHKRQRGSRTSRLPLVSKVNIFSQGKVQRIKPTYPMQALLQSSITKVESCVSDNSFMWGIVGFFERYVTFVIKCD